MRRDTPFTRTQWCRVFCFFGDCFRNLLGNTSVFRFVFHDLTVYDTFSFETFADCDRINIIKTFLLLLGIELVIPYQPVQCVGSICPGNLTGFVIYHDRKRGEITAEHFTQALRDFLGCMSLSDIPLNGMLTLDIAVPFPERSFDIHLCDDPVRGNISARFRIHDRRVMHPGLR